MSIIIGQGNSDLKYQIIVISIKINHLQLFFHYLEICSIFLNYLVICLFLLYFLLKSQFCLTAPYQDWTSLILTFRSFTVGGEFVVIRKSVQLFTGSEGQTTLRRSLYAALSFRPGQVPVGPGITRGNSLQKIK